MPQQSLAPIRFTLALVAIMTGIAAYLFLFAPLAILGFYNVTLPDLAHVQLCAVIGLMLSVLTMGTVLAFFRPAKHSGIVLLIIIIHFLLFLFDLTIIIQGTPLPLFLLITEIIYFLLVCVLLVRFYPTLPRPEVSGDTANALVTAVRKHLKREEKETDKIRRQVEDERKQIEKDVEKKHEEKGE